MTIEHQKIVAKEILDKLSVICPYTILAGGAPRDWYFNTEATDLDFYFASTGLTQGATQSQINKLFGDGVFKPRNWKVQQDAMYKTMKFLKRIWDGEIDGIKIQLIELQGVEYCFKVVDSMSVSICKAWWKGNKIHTLEDFKLTVASGVMFVSQGYTWTDPHPNKIKNKFKNFSCHTKKVAQEVLLQKAYEGL